MDFFERQAIARKHTKWLEVYFALAIFGIVVTTYLATVLCIRIVNPLHGGRLLDQRFTESQYLSMHDSLWQPKILGIVALSTIGFIFCGSLWKTAQLASGGIAVAEALGGRLIAANSTDPDERKLLNVVEEMSIASGTPVPQVYVMPMEQGINAFAAGHSTKDMVICVTNGSMRYLTRDELQGVIGHEFSHILNGDMRLNLRLMGLVFGILCIALFGKILLQSIRLRSDSRENAGQLVLVLGGVALFAIGSLGFFFAKLIKSAVNRQREFLADASSVQFTRNPEGLAGALKKVGGYGSQIDDANADDASHFFFANGLRSSFFETFSTHPPLDERIRLLEPGWDGKFVVPKAGEQRDVAIGEVLENDLADILRTPRQPGVSPRLDDLLGGRAGGLPVGPMTIAAAGVLSQAGRPTPKHLDYAADLRANLPATLAAAAREPMTAVALIYALLLSKDDSLRAKQLDQLEKQTDTGISQETEKLLPEVLKLDPRGRLPLASLSMTALRRLSPAQYAQFTANIKSIIESDDEIELFEYTLQKIVLRQLDANFAPPKRTLVQYYALRGLERECAVVLSAVACAGQNDAAGIQNAFQQGAAVLNLPNCTLLSPEQCGLDAVDAALDKLNQTTPQLKKVFLNACALAVAADGVIQENEAELLRAIADTLDCPIPPLVTL